MFNSEGLLSKGTPALFSATPCQSSAQSQKSECVGLRLGASKGAQPGVGGWVGGAPSLLVRILLLILSLLTVDLFLPLLCDGRRPRKVVTTPLCHRK